MKIAHSRLCRWLEHDAILVNNLVPVHEECPFGKFLFYEVKLSSTLHILAVKRSEKD